MVYGDGYDRKPSSFGGEARDNFLALKIEKESTRAMEEEARLQAQIDEGIASDAARYLGISQNLDTGVVSIEILNKRNIRLDKKDITITNKLLTAASLNTETRRLILTCINGETISCDLTPIFESLQEALIGVSTLSSSLEAETTRAEEAEGDLHDEIDAVASDLSAEISQREAVNADLATHKNNTENPHSVTKAQVGLGNVDNTSDLDKPVSTATQTALNLKANSTDVYTKEIMDAALGQKQPNLVSGINIKTVNGNTLLGSGNLVTEAYHTFPNSWTTNGTTRDFCASIESDTSALAGTAYLGTLRCSDLPANMVQVEAVVEIISVGANGKCINITITSLEVIPYRWTYSYGIVNGNVVTVGWTGVQSELASGINIKTIHGQSVLGSGNIDIVGPQGPQGPQGEQGPQGPQGNGIVGITKTSTSGLVDTYTITYINGTTSTFTVTNGADGSEGPQGEQGPKGDDGLTTSISVNNTTYTQNQGLITLPDYPTIPTNLSSFTNDSGFITNSAISDMATQTWVGQQGYLTSITSSDVTTALGYTPGTSNFSGDYNALTNKPTIPAAQIQSDWDQTNTSAVDFIKNKPTIPTTFIEDVKVNGTSVVNNKVAEVSVPAIPNNLSAFTNDVGYITGISWGAITGKPNFAIVAQSGSYLDLTDKPTLFSGSYNDLTDKPTLFSGDYNDLTNKPTIPDEVTANPTLAGNEALLEGLQVGSTKYTTIRTVNLITTGEATALEASVLEQYKFIIMTGYKVGVTQPNATTIVFTPALLGSSYDAAEVFRCIARNNPADWEYTLRVWKETSITPNLIKWQSDTDYGGSHAWNATVILGVN